MRSATVKVEVIVWTLRGVVLCHRVFGSNFTWSPLFLPGCGEGKVVR